MGSPTEGILISASAGPSKKPGPWAQEPTVLRAQTQPASVHQSVVRPRHRSQGWPRLSPQRGWERQVPPSPPPPLPPRGAGGHSRRPSRLNLPVPGQQGRHFPRCLRPLETIRRRGAGGADPWPATSLTFGIRRLAHVWLVGHPPVHRDSTGGGSTESNLARSNTALPRGSLTRSKVGVF